MKRISEMTDRELLNYACCGDPDDDDTLIDMSDEDEED